MGKRSASSIGERRCRRKCPSAMKKVLTLRVEHIFEVLEDEGKLEDSGIVGCSQQREESATEIPDEIERSRKTHLRW